MADVPLLTPTAHDARDHAGITGLAFMGCSLTKSASQSITESTSTAVTFNGEEFDTDTLHDNSSNTSRIVLKKVGYWMVGASIAWEATMVDQKRWHMWLQVNGSTTLAGQTRRQTSGTQFQTAQFSRIVQATAITDYVEVMVFQEDTTARNIRNTGCVFWAHFIAE